MEIKDLQQIAIMENEIMNWKLQDLQTLRKELIKDNYNLKGI